MRILKADGPDDGVREMARRISSALKEGKAVLWLVPGGSNVSAAAEAMRAIRAAVPKKALKLLSVSLTDERYGPINHKDSNWRQLVEADFDFDDVHQIPVLVGLSLDDTVKAWGASLKKAWEEADLAVGLFGIGADGHVAGALPNVPGAFLNEIVFGYDGGQYRRVTLCLKAIASLDVAYAFAFGSAKRKAIQGLASDDVPFGDQPCHILKLVPDSTLWTDQA